MSYFDARPDDDVRDEEITEKIYKWVMNFFRQLPVAYVYIAVVFIVIVATVTGASAARPYLMARGSGCGDIMVLPGETFSEIAKREGTNVPGLLNANPQIIDVDLVFANEMLCRPDAEDQAAGDSAIAALSRGAIAGIEKTEPPRQSFDNEYLGQSNNVDYGQARPGAKALAAALDTRYARFGSAVDSDFGVGLYARRPIRGGSNWSSHADGRSVDIYLPSDECFSNRLEAFEMFGGLVKHAEQLGITRLLMCDLEWRSGAGWMVPSEALADMHGMDPSAYPAHIHIAMSPDAADNLKLSWATEVVNRS